MVRLKRSPRGGADRVRTVWTPAYYCLFYAALASLSPFLVVFYRAHGLGPAVIGLLGAIPPVMQLLGAPLWSGMADAFQGHRRLFVLATAGAILAVAALSRMTAVAWLALAVAGFAFFSAPLMPLVDSSTLAILGDRREEYGRFRLWGAVGWGVAAPVVGALVQRSGLHWPFIGYIVLMLIALFVGTRLRLGQGSLPASFRSGLSSVVRNPSWRIFLAIVFVCGVGLSAINVFLFLYMAQLGSSETLMGLALTMGTISEIPFFFFTGRLIRRWGARGLLLFGMAVYVVRVVLYSVTQTAWPVLLIQLLHGPTFSAIWVAGVSYADEIAPPGLGTTAQGMLSAVYVGLGGSIGAVAAGVLFQYLGIDWMFRIIGVIVAIAIAAFIVLDRASRRQARGA